MTKETGELTYEVLESERELFLTTLELIKKVDVLESDEVYRSTVGLLVEAALLGVPEREVPRVTTLGDKFTEMLERRNAEAIDLEQQDTNKFKVNDRVATQLGHHGVVVDVMIPSAMETERYVVQLDGVTTVKTYLPKELQPEGFA